MAARLLQDTDITESMMATTFLAENFGLVLLLHVHLDSYYNSNKNKKICSIEGLVEGFDIGARIINKMTEYIIRSIFPDWIFAHSIDDIINLAFEFKDVDLVCEILAIANSKGNGITLSSGNIEHLISLLKNQNNQNTVKGAPPQSKFHKNYVYSKQAIIAGVLSAGRNRIAGVKTLIDVQEQTSEIIGVSASTVKKNCYDKKHNPAGVELRSIAEETAKPIFIKLNKNEQLPTPTPLECYMVLFDAIFGVENIWTGKTTAEGIPILQMI